MFKVCTKHLLLLTKILALAFSLTVRKTCLLFTNFAAQRSSAALCVLLLNEASASFKTCS